MIKDGVRTKEVNFKIAHVLHIEIKLILKKDLYFARLAMDIHFQFLVETDQQ